jgi:hypothetical protein
MNVPRPYHAPPSSPADHNPPYSDNPGYLWDYVLPSTPQNSEVVPEIHHVLHLETLPVEYLDELLKDKIKRHISSSGPGNLAQEDPRSRIF